MRIKSIVIPVLILLIFISCKQGVSIERLKAGEKVYTRYCSGCHMDNGGGVPNMNAPLISSAIVNGDEEKLINVVLIGSGALLSDPNRRFRNTMGSFAYLSDVEIADVLTYIRNNFNNKAPEIDPDQIKEVRAKPL
jgi:mono/diheme cytochrome c family protein